MRFVLFGILICSFAFAQSFQGTLRGRVLDPAGAAISAAEITLTEEGTLFPRSTVTNGEGKYTFASLQPATHTVAVESPRFKRLQRHGVTVSTQALVTLDLVLQLGRLTEQINVLADAPLLQTGDASTGQVIDGHQITDLPILGRNTFFTAKLAHSVVFVGNPKFARMQDQNANSQVAIAGGPVRTNNYLVDGISITGSTNRAVIVPSPEAVQELKLQLSTYDAEAGRTGGGTFNTVLRSGTNDLHGSAVGHIRDTDWLANNFFANRAGQPIANQPFRDWAFSLGGPIRIPKIYDGRNKTFVFITTEAYRQQDGSTLAYAVPTALERAGDFSQTFARNGGKQLIYDPLTTAADGTRQQFAGNLMPASRLNSVGKTLASYYPLPNATTPYYGAPNYNFTGSYPNRGDQTTWKADHEFTTWFRASGSYIHQKTFETEIPLSTFPNAADPGQNFCCDRKIDATQANATLTPSATTVIAIRWGFNRFSAKSTQASAGFDLSSLGLPPSLVSATPNPAFPGISMDDLSSFGGGPTNQDVYYSRSLNATLSKFFGKHSIKAGFDFRTLHDAGTPPSGPTSFGFSDVFTRATPQATTAKWSSYLCPADPRDSWPSSQPIGMRLAVRDATLECVMVGDKAWEMHILIELEVPASGCFRHVRTIPKICERFQVPRRINEYDLAFSWRPA